MLGKRIAAAAVLAACAATGRGDVAGALATLKKVGKEGLGNPAATAAWKELAAAKPDEIPVALAGWQGLHPVAANYLHSALAAAGEAAGDKLPADRLEAFLKDAANDPEARRLAFELLVRAKPDRKEALLDGFRDDPSRELRFDAVAQLAGRAEAALKAGKKEPALEQYLQALSAARDLRQVSGLAAAIRKQGKPLDLARHFGMIQQWRIVGPFDNLGGKGFDKAYPPEEQYDPKGEYAGQKGKVKWFEHDCVDELGSVELNDVYKERHKGSVTYAAAEFVADRDFAGEIRLGSIVAWKLWVNGAPLFQRNESHAGFAFDQYVVPAKFGKGRNVILLKLCQNEQTEPWAQNYNFALRVCDRSGTAILSEHRPPARPSLGRTEDEGKDKEGKAKGKDAAKDAPKKGKT